MEDWAEIRRLHRVEGVAIKAIARRLGVSRNAVRRALARDAPPKYVRAPKGSIVDAVEPAIRELLREHPRMPATVIAERVGWERSLTVLKDRVRELRPYYLPPDPATRTAYDPGQRVQCDLWFPPASVPLGFGHTGHPPVLVMVSGATAVRWGRSCSDANECCQQSIAGPKASPTVTVVVMSTAPPLGRHLAAMVTPMTPDGRISTPDVERLVDHLLAGGCDGIVVGGTTGEAPTLTRDEIGALVRSVAARTKGAAHVIAGVGSNVTTDSIAAARAAATAGADGLLLVTPYYSRPSQTGLVEHCSAVAGTTDVPVLLYDVPARTGTALTPASWGSRMRREISSSRWRWPGRPVSTTTAAWTSSTSRTSQRGPWDSSRSWPTSRPSSPADSSTPSTPETSVWPGWSTTTCCPWPSASCGPGRVLPRPRPPWPPQA